MRATIPKCFDASLLPMADLASAQSLPAGDRQLTATDRPTDSDRQATGTNDDADYS